MLEGQSSLKARSSQFGENVQHRKIHIRPPNMTKIEMYGRALILGTHILGVDGTRELIKFLFKDREKL